MFWVMFDEMHFWYFPERSIMAPATISPMKSVSTIMRKSPVPAGSVFEELANLRVGDGVFIVSVDTISYVRGVSVSVSL